MADTVSDALLARLIDWGVDTIFGIPGDGINGFMEALRKRRDEVRFVHTRHEETAALAAAPTPSSPADSGCACRRRRRWPRSWRRGCPTGSPPR